MTFTKYARWVAKRWKNKWSRTYPFYTLEHKNIAICALGLAGETGEVVEHFKKWIRDERPLDGNKDLYLELGDVLHYWLRLCHYANIKPEEVMEMNIAKLEARDKK